MINVNIKTNSKVDKIWIVFLGKFCVYKFFKVGR